MDSLSSIWSIVLLFVLRLGVPLLITLGIAYGLKRLDARWQAEARQQRQVEPVTTKSLATNAPQGWSRLPQPSLAAGAESRPCWVVKGCTEAMRAACAAYNQPSLPCWQARTSAEGRMPAECKGCDFYLPAPLQRDRIAIVH
jgi:hypothetical protein